MEVCAQGLQVRILYKRTGYLLSSVTRPTSSITRHEDGLDYELVDDMGFTTLRTPLKVRWHQDGNGDYVLDFWWTLLSDTKVNTHWTYHAASDKETDMTVVQKLEGPRWKTALFTASFAQKDFLLRMENVASHLAQE